MRHRLSRRPYTEKTTLNRITSSHNSLIKDVRRAADRGTLTEEGFAVAEGMHLFTEALASSVEIGALLVSEEILDRDWPPHLNLYALPKALFRDVASTEAPQGIVTLVRPPTFSLDQILQGRAILLDGIQDPGNAGAIVRATEAFGGSGVVFLKNTVSPFNPKCLRASAGSLFRLPFLHHPDSRELQMKLTHLYAAMPHAEHTIDTVQWPARAAIVIGSEGRGVSADWASLATHVQIPTTGVESLNAAVAASVILYEARRYS